MRTFCAWRRWVPRLALGISILILTDGCTVVSAGAAAGSAAGNFVQGELKHTEGVPFDAVWDATLAGLDSLGVSVTKQKKEALKASVLAWDSDGRRIRVHLQKRTANTTEVGIRIGLGQRKRSREILEAIRSHYPGKT